jgi:hypothetical protein
MELDLFLRGKTSAATFHPRAISRSVWRSKTEDGRLKIEDRSSILYYLSLIGSAKPCGTRQGEIQGCGSTHDEQRIKQPKQSGVVSNNSAAVYDFRPHRWLSCRQCARNTFRWRPAAEPPPSTPPPCPPQSVPRQPARLRPSQPSWAA